MDEAAYYMTAPDRISERQVQDYLLYAYGLRIGEAVALPVTAVDSKQMILRVIGKRNKQRALPPTELKKSSDKTPRYDPKTRLVPCMDRLGARLHFRVFSSSIRSASTGRLLKYSNHRTIIAPRISGPSSRYSARVFPQ